MIKFIKKWICKIFRIKQCACPEEMDPHEELMLHVPEPEVPLYMEDGKYLKCGTHNRYKKSCPICREVAGVV